MAELRMPFVADNRALLAAQVCSRRSTPISPSSGYSPALRNVVQLMLDKDPKVRPGPSAIISYAKRIAQNGRHLHVTRGGSPTGSPAGAAPEQRNDGPGPPVGGEPPLRADGARDPWGEAVRLLAQLSLAAFAATERVARCGAALRRLPRAPSAEAVVSAEPSVAREQKGARASPSGRRLSPFAAPALQGTGQGAAARPSRSPRDRYPSAPAVVVSRSPIPSLPPPPAGPH
ncbi:unnamed protein product, partial [Polarella glacialis]